MLVVFPPGMKHDEFAMTSAYEDHLLERVSLLEMRLLQVSESLSMTLEVLKSQSQIMRDEHNLVRELYESLKHLESENRGKILPKWDEAFEKHELGSSPRINEILAADDIKNFEMLELLVREAFEFIEKKDERQVFAALKRAEPISPKNVPLLLLFAEQLFYADKFEEARQKLEKAYKISPDDERIRLFLGAVYADEIEIGKTEKLLDFSTENDKINCTSDFISAMSAVYQSDLETAVELFEKSLENFKFPETLYLLASVFFQKQNFKKSLKYCEKTIESDKNFTDAYFLKSLNYSLLNKKKKADETLQSVIGNLENGAQCIEFVTAKNKIDLQIALPFTHFENKKRLLTGGSQRVRKFVRYLIFNVLNG